MTARRNTRAERARVLLARLERGPSLRMMFGRTYSREEAEADVQGWIRAWILDEVIALVPELAKEKKL